ncbi:MAG: GYF domain-containing protein [Luteolibacter sp.]
MQWYYAKNGSQLGPLEQGELLAKISSGEIAQSDMVWREGLGDWLPVSKVNELVMVARPVPPLSAPAPANGVDSPYSPPVSINTSGPVMMPTPSSGRATASMVLGIVGLVFAICGCYGIVVSLPCAILAIVFGGQFKKEAALNPSLMGELGKANAGVIMGWIAIGISVLFTILIISLGVASQAFSGFHR